MNMHNLFPIPIGMFDLDRELTDEELLFVRGQETRPNEGNTTSVNNFVLRDMTSLRDWIEGCVAEYFKATSDPKHDVHLRITQSWFNYSEQGQWHHKHAHPNSFVSGVFISIQILTTRFISIVLDGNRLNSRLSHGIRITLKHGGLRQLKED
jgi:hypothetical protein